MKYLTVDAQLFEEFIENIRQEDIEECEVSSTIHWEDYVPLLKRKAMDRGCALVYKNAVIGIFCVEEIEGEPVGWLLLTRAVNQCKLAFLRQTRTYIQEVVFAKFDYFTNFVYVENTLHLRWLDWLGAKFAKTTDDRFMKFILRKEDVNV